METKPDSRSRRELEHEEVVAGNGLLHRRAFLAGGAAVAAAITGYTLSDTAAAQQLADDPWSRTRGVTVPAYGVPSGFEKNVVRTLSNPEGRAAHAARADAAPPAQRHVHARTACISSSRTPATRTSIRPDTAW